MKKNAFTLIELIGVVVIIALVLLISVPSIIKTIKKSEENKITEFKNNIYMAAENYIETNRNLYPNLNNVGDMTTITVSKLKDAGLLKSDLKYPNTNENIDNVVIKIYINSEGIFEYIYNYTDNYLSILDVVLEKFPQLALGNTIDKGCATASSSNYTYMGGCYLKGLQTENYIWFNGFLYRIMGINKDSSIKLITEGNLTAISWGANNSAQNYNGSYIKHWLNNYFLSVTNTNSNLNSNIVSQTFCSEKTTNASPTRTVCTTNLDTDANKSVGIIAVDEYNLAGATNSYINTLQYYWTITPYNASTGWRTDTSGAFSNRAVTFANGTRATINIDQDTIITSGDGKLSSYYILGEIKTNTSNISLSAKVKVGEYVTFAGKNYRVIEIDNTSVKLVLDGYSSTTYAYGTSGSTIPNCTICSTINETSFINWITNENSSNYDKLQTRTWYRSDSYEYGSNYVNFLTSTNNSYTGMVGLIRVGEILSDQSASISSKKTYWIANPFSNSKAWYINDGGSLNNIAVTESYYIRPVISIKTNTNIISGLGTSLNPYQI